MSQGKFASAAIVTSIVLGSMVLGCRGGNSRIMPPDERPTFSVVGKVTVDGQPPVAPVKIIATPKDESLKKPGYRLPNAITDEKGSFKLNTFKMGDGAPTGEFDITLVQFDAGNIGIGKKKKGGGDLLRGRYSNPKDIKFQLTVEKKAVDMGTLELTTK